MDDTETSPTGHDAGTRGGSRPPKADPRHPVDVPDLPWNRRSASERLACVVTNAPSWVMGLVSCGGFLAVFGAVTWALFVMAVGRFAGGEEPVVGIVPWLVVWGGGVAVWHLAREVDRRAGARATPPDRETEGRP